MDLSPNPGEEFFIVRGDDFLSWESLNDSIMGGSSSAFCRNTSKGLLLQGELVEAGGGFVSCRSQKLSKPLNLSKFEGFCLEVEGEGRTLKFAFGCQSKYFGFNQLFFSNIRWIAAVPTETNGLTRIKLPFEKFEPSIRAKPVNLPLRLDISQINQFQLLHSKFGQPGKLNPGFKPGLIRILLRSISAYS